MSKRRDRKFDEIETLEVALSQGAVVPCYRCRVAFKLEDLKGRNVQKEHLHERALEGPDEPSNARFSHVDCHKVVTFGNGATTAGSSIGRISKAKRIERTEKMKVVKPGPQPPLPPVLKLQQMVDAELRCRRCGQYPGECLCPAPQQRTGFQRRFG